MPASPRPSGSACSRRGSTPAASPCCRSAAPAACTPSRWPRNWGWTRWCSRADASTFSASGILHSDIVHDLARSRLMPADPASLPALAAACAELRAQGDALLRADGLPLERARSACRPTCAMPGRRSSWWCPGATSAGPTRWRRLIADFHALHRRRFSYANPDDPVDIVTLRLTATGRLPPAPAGPARPPPRGAPPPPRRVFLDGAWRDIAGLPPRRRDRPAPRSRADRGSLHHRSSSPPAGDAAPGGTATWWRGACGADA